MSGKPVKVTSAKPSAVAVPNAPVIEMPVGITVTSPCIPIVPKFPDKEFPVGIRVPAIPQACSPHSNLPQPKLISALTVTLPRFPERA